ncbi:MAG: hypothetical protein AB1758_35865, partial [Candidatus Eremiobacterota bacterium]
MIITQQSAAYGRHASSVARASGDLQPAPEQDQAVISGEEKKWGPDPITPMFNAIVTGGCGLVGLIGGAVIGHFAFGAPVVGGLIGAGTGAVVG